MKKVVSVSLGSHKRDHCVEVNLLGETFLIERIGTDGDLDKAVDTIKRLDGKVDAFGMGGIDLYIVAGEKRYMLRDAKRLKDAAILTPIVDGSGLKNTLERRVIEYLHRSKLIDFQGKRVLMVCGVDRFGMAEALEECGAIITYGDIIFGLGLPFPIHSLKALIGAARLLAPIASQLPFEMLYPTGAKQEISVDRFNEYYQDADIIAGDFLFIKRYLPRTLMNKIIITNSVTKEDVFLLKERGIAQLITTTPELNGRSFGTNVMEAVLVALAQGKQELSAAEYQSLLDKVGFSPRVLDFGQENLA